MKPKAKAAKAGPASAAEASQKKKIRRCKFDPERTPIEMLESIVRGASVKEATRSVGLTDSTIEYHRSKWPVLDRAIRTAVILQRWVKEEQAGLLADKGKAEKAEAGKTFQDYALGNLPPELRAVWDEMAPVKKAQDAADLFTELTSGMGRKARQRLFIQCFLYNSFSVADACRRTGISRTCVDFWIAQDPEFAALFIEIRKYQKDFVETALMDLVALRNPQAVIFANKTLNRDRGYAETLEVNVNHTAAEFNFDDLDLSLECRKEILAAMRRQKGVIDATVVNRIEDHRMVEDDEPIFDGDE